MENVVLTTPNQLSQLIDEAVYKALQKAKFNHQKTEPRPQLEKYLTVAEAASYLKCAKPTLYQMVSERTVPFIKNGSRTLFDTADLNEWMSQKKKNFTKLNKI
ncbi:MAG: excisionase family DNA binding protein [Vicingaceae bacterium]|jgi:excisionase family DNA binding protein